MILTIDIGNSNTVIGTFQNRKLRRTWRIPSDKKAVLRWAHSVKISVEGVIISSVVPELDQPLRNICKRFFKRRALFVTPELKMPIRIRVDSPNLVGADRIVNAVAAHVLYAHQPFSIFVRNITARCRDVFGTKVQSEVGWRPCRLSGKPLLIIDFGTATTFDVVNERGDFLGGIITAGLKTINEALAKKCARLPKVPIGRPRHVIGRNTREAIQSGIFHGYAALVEGLISRIEKEAKKKFRVIATGGLAPLLARETKKIHLTDPDLTLKGLEMLFTSASRPDARSLPREH